MDLATARNLVRNAVGIASRATDTAGRDKDSIEAEIERARSELVRLGLASFERERTLTPDGSGNLNVPSGEAFVRVHPSESARVVVENGKLYDTDEQTLVWTVASLKVVTRLDTPFAEMEDVFQQAIVAMAALGYWQRYVRGNAPRTGRDRVDAQELRLADEAEQRLGDARRHDSRLDETNMRGGSEALRATGRTTGGGRWRTT